VSDGAALWSGLTLFMVLFPSLLAQAMFTRFFSGAPTVRNDRRVGFPFLYSRLLVAALIVNLLILFYALRHWGAHEISVDAEPQTGLMLFGQLWIFLCMGNFTWLAISMRDDAMERRNPAAFLALLGAIFAIGLIYTGANIGEGPSYANNLFCAALGTGAFCLVGLTLELSTRISTAICEGRDVATGIRIGGFFLAQGLIIARALAGDWHSTAATLRDFVHDGIFSPALLLIAIPIERLTQPTARNPSPHWLTRGLGFATLYVVATVFWLLRLGWWEGFRR
jgi:hypothetical protein